MAERVPTFEEFVAEKIRTGQFNPYGGTPPQSMMSNTQLQSRGPGYGSQAARVANAPVGPVSLPVDPVDQRMAELEATQAGIVQGRDVIQEANMLRAGQVGQDRPTFVDRDLQPGMPNAPTYGSPATLTGSLMQTIFPTGFDFTPPDPNEQPKAETSFDPEAMYRAYLEQGMSPEVARSRVNAAVEAEVGPAQQTLDAGRDPLKHDDGTGGLLSWIGGAIDKPRQFTQGNEAEDLYDYLTQTSMTVEQAIAAGIAQPGTTPEMWQQYLDLTYGQGGVRGADFMSVQTNPDDPTQVDYFALYDTLSPQDQATFKREFLDAYENGYSPTKKVMTDIGTWVDVPTGEFFEPGPTAGHEYIASTKSWWERLGSDVAQDPTSLLGLEKAPLEALASYGSRVAAAESAGYGAKVVGKSLNMFARAAKTPNAVLNVAPDVVIQAPLSAIGEAMAPYTDIFKRHVKGTALIEGNNYTDAQLEANQAGQTASGYTPPAPVVIDPVTGAPSGTTLTQQPDLPMGGSTPPTPPLAGRSTPFGAGTPAKAENAIPANPNQADIDDMNRQIQIREDLLQDGSLSPDDAASMQREIAELRQGVSDLEGPKPVSVAQEPQQGPLFPTEFDEFGNIVIAEIDLPIWEPDPNLRPAWQNSLGPATGPVGPQAAEPLPIPFERITSELVQRRLDLQQIDVRLEESAIGTLRGNPPDSEAEVALRQQRDEVEQIVADLEEVVADLEQRAPNPAEIEQAAAEVVAPADDGYTTWLAGVKDGSINMFDPRSTRPNRLIDQVAQSEKWGDFDKINVGKRSEAWSTDLIIQSDIDALKAEVRALPYQQGREVWATEIYPRIVDQQIAGVYHLVNDVIPDLRATGVDIGDIPISSERASLANKVIADADAPGEITVVGGRNKSGTEQKRYVRQEADGTFSVRKTAKAKTPIKAGLSEEDAIKFADKDLAEFPRKAQYQEDNIGYLIERAIIKDEDVVNDALRNRIGTSSPGVDPVTGNDGPWTVRITPEQYEMVQELRLQLRAALGKTNYTPDQIADAWNNIRGEMLADIRTRRDIPMNEERGLIYRITTEAKSYDDAMKRLKSDALYGAETKNLRDKIASNIRTAVNERLSRDGMVEFNSGMNPFGTRDRDPGVARRVATRAFQASPVSTASEQAEGILESRFRGGEYSGLRYRDVYEKVNLPKVKEKVALARRLKESGADPDRLTREQVMDIRKRKKDKIVEIKAQSPAGGQMTIGAMTPNLRQRLTHSRRIEANISYADLTDDQALAAIQMELGRFGDVLTDTPEEIATHLTAMDIAESIDPTLMNQRRLAADFLHLLVYRLPRTLLLADPLTAWTYTMRNVMSNWMMTTMNNPSWVFSGDGWEAVRGATGDATLDKSVAAEMNAVLTGGHIPQELRSTVDKMSEILAREKTPIARAVDDLWGDIPVLTKVAGAFDWKRGIDRGIERGMKIGAGYVPFLRINVDQSILQLSEEMSMYATARGIPATQQELFDRLWDLKDSNGVFSRHDVYDAFYYQAIDSGITESAARKYAETASRRWQNLGKQAELDAVARVEKVYPSNLNQTNLDHYLNYIAFFHFWPSRAAKFMLEEMIRHPQYALWWYRAHAGVARMAEEGEYPDSVKGLLKVMSGPFGMALYGNPAAFFMVTSLLPAGPELPDRQGTTKLGSMLSEIKDATGTGPVPFIDAALNLIGIYGDQYMPDVFPSRTADLALAALDAALVAGGHHPHSPVWDQTMENARETFSAMMPWSDGGVPAGDASGYIQDVVGSMVLQQNPELWQRMSAVEQYMAADGTMQTRPTADAAAAQEEFNAIMDNDDDPRYVNAEKAVVYGNLFVKGLNLISPMSMRGKPIYRTESIQLANQGRDKREVDTEPTPQEVAQIGLRSVVTDSPDSRQLKAERAQVQAFGTTRQVTLDDGYRQIAYEDIRPGTVMVIGNDIYTWEDVMTMSEDERLGLADKWLVANNGLDEYTSYKEGKKELTATLPMVDDYNGWAKKFRNEDGTINETYRTNYIKSSPGYAAYMDQLPDEIKNDPAEYDEKSVSQDAYLAASGMSTSVYNKPFGDASDPTAMRPDEFGGGGESSSGGSGGGSTDYESAANRLEKLNKSIAKYETEMAAFDKKVMAITGGVAFDDLAPAWQTSLAKRLEREGVKVPSKPATVRNYEEWRDLQEASGLPSDKMTYIEWTLEEAANLAEEAAA